MRSFGMHHPHGYASVAIHCGGGGGDGDDDGGGGGGIGEKHIFGSWNITDGRDLIKTHILTGSFGSVG